MMLRKQYLKNANYFLLLLVIAAMSMGVVVINSVDTYYTGKQTIGAVISLVIILAVMAFDYHIFVRLYIPLYLISTALLLGVLFFGINVNNATRWFTLGSITFQPSELTKVIMIVYMANLLTKLTDEDKVNTFRGLMRFGAATLVPIVLIYKQPDLSTTLCMTFVLLTMLYLAGLSYKIILTALLILIPAFTVFIWYVQKPDQKLLYEHQVNRIMSFIYPSEYQDTNDQQNYSIMAIGNGRLKGQGLNAEGTVKASGIIPEQQTDFIFSAIGESFGFIGSVITLALILLIVLQCIRVARRARDITGRLLAMGVACLIGYQSFINIGVTTKLLPNTGIPLPFISYGLSSLMSTAIGIGLVLNVSMQKRKF